MQSSMLSLTRLTETRPCDSTGAVGVRGGATLTLYPSSASIWRDQGAIWMAAKVLDVSYGHLHTTVATSEDSPGDVEETCDSRCET